MKVIGTAGHIDHGKSALVHRLTGIDPDRLSEEKRRGMTIDLGFAWLTLSSGRDVSIVDVPGHERFVKNMLAGAGGIDVALLVVAADEGVMPQTREHLDILDLLGVEHGVVALTKVDLVDDDWLQLATEDVKELLRGRPLQSAAIVPVSSVTGQGLEELLNALNAAVAATPAPEDRKIPYLPVDRVFSVAGFGTVATGTLHAGHLTVGEEVEIVPGGRRGRIRNLETHRRQVTEAEPGSRVAANLAGISREQLVRGDLLARPGTVRAVSRTDARVRVLADAPFPLRHGMELTVHIGAAERPATLAIFPGKEIAPGESGWAQLRLSQPVGALRGQRFILRLPAPLRTVAGGEIVDIAPRHRRSDPSAVRRLEELSSESLPEAVLAALPRNQVRTAGQLAGLLGADKEEVASALTRLQQSGTAVHLANHYVSTAGWTALLSRVQRALQAYHEIYPLRRGMPREELRSKVLWPRTVWTETLRALIQSGVVREHGTLIALPEHAGGTASRRIEADRVLGALQADPFSPPSGQELLDLTGTDDTLLSAMVEEGEIVRVADGIFFAREAYHEMVSRTLDLLQGDGQVTVATLRDAFGTSRKYALSFLEHLDGERITRRVGDVRVPGSKGVMSHES